MDHMKIETTLMKNCLSKLAEKFLKKKLKRDISTQINGLNITNEDGKIHAHIDLDVEMDAAELKEMLDAMTF